jgi:secretion/DNA translocation related TadE-like protein
VIERQRGSVTILVAAGALLLSLSALAVADVGAMLVARGRAQAAADAAALAAVAQQAPILDQGSDPEGAARETAERNGVVLISCACEVGTPDATVEVELTPRLGFLSGWFGRRVHARAHAHLDEDVFTYREGPAPTPSPSSS